MSFYGFDIRHTLWRPCDGMAKKRQSPSHLRRVFWRLSRCLRVIRINCESQGIFLWYLSKTPGQIEGMANRKSSQSQPQMPLATTENSGFSVLLRLVHRPAGEPPSVHSARGSASGGVCWNLWSLPFSRHVENAVTFSTLAQRRKQNTIRRMGISDDVPQASLCEGACLRAREQQVEYPREPTCLSN